MARRGRCALVSCAIFGFGLSTLTLTTPAIAVCEPQGTDFSDTIVCDDTDVAGVAARAGADEIRVLPGASVDVSRELTDIESFLVAIDAGGGNDRVINNGVVRNNISLVRRPPSGSLGNTPNSGWGVPDPITDFLLSATGVRGASGDDFIDNQGSIEVAISAETTRAETTPTATTPNGNHEPQPGPGEGEPTETDTAVSVVAIAGSSGNDRISNNGNTSASADAVDSALAINVSLLGGEQTDVSTTLQTEASGITGDAGDDVIDNAGTLSVNAGSDLSGVSVQANLIDTSRATANTTAQAASVGIDAGADNDTVTSGGTLSTAASARISSVDVEVNGADAALADAATHAAASATAIDAGSGKDSIDVGGALSATSNSEVDAIGVNVSFLDVTIADREGSDAQTSAVAVSDGINAGSGQDTIRIREGGSVEALANADVQSIGVAVASEGVPGSIEQLILEGSLASVGITTDATANGIAAGTQADVLDVAGNVAADATSNATQASVNVGIAVFDFGIPTPGIVIGGAGTRANASASGLLGEGGSDEINLSGDLDVDAAADAAATTVSVNIAELSIPVVPGDGVPFGVSLVVADTATEARSDGVGISGGDADDRITSSGDIDVNVEADAGSTSVAATLNLQFGEDDDVLTVDAQLSRATTESDAQGTGIAGDAGQDVVDNQGALAVSTLADTTAVGVNVGIAGTLQGAGGAIGISASDTSNLASATSTGIDGGAGDDALRNSGAVSVDAVTDINAVNVSVTAGIAQDGLVVGVGLVRSENNAVSSATGMHGGSGDNPISNSGSIQADATSEVDSVAVTATLGGTARGVTAGVILADASASADTSAVAMRSGGSIAPPVPSPGRPHDVPVWDTPTPPHSVPVMTNSGNIGAGADADTSTTNVTAEISIAQRGAAIGVALADSSATANAASAGMLGDDARNVLDNAGGITVDADADAQAVSVSVTVEGTASGLAAGAALVDAGVTANAEASGMQAGGDNDWIANTGTIAADRVSAQATAVGVGASAFVAQQGAALGAALGRTRAVADASASGMQGGDGADRIGNAGSVSLTDIAAAADGVTVSVGVTATQQGFGVSGALADSGTDAHSSAYALTGGGGVDHIDNTGTVTLGNVSADADAVSVSIGIAGTQTGAVVSGAVVDATAVADVDAAAIDGGTQNDHLDNHGTLTVTNIDARSDAMGVGVGIALAQTGLTVGGALALSGTESELTAAGMRGGTGDDHMQNFSTIALNDLHADADAVSVSVGVAGAATGLSIGAGLVDAAGSAGMDVSGMHGGAGDDELYNEGRISVSDVDAEAAATGVSAALSGSNTGVSVGVTLADTSAAADAEISGMAGGDGDGGLFSDGSIALSDLAADANAVNVAVSVAANLSAGVAGGAALARADSQARMDAAGMRGSDGWEWFHNQGTIDVTGVRTDTDVTTATVTLGVTNAGVALGGALADLSGSADTRAAGIDAGAGRDTIHNENTIRVRDIASDVTATGVSVGLNGAITGGVAAGLSLSDGSATATTDAVGIDAGDGDDTLLNSGDVSVSNASSSAGATGVSVTVSASAAGLAGGAAVADTSADAGTTVTGLRGGAGDDIMHNSGAIDVAGRADSNGVSVGVSVNAALGVGGGAELVDATSMATSTVMGIDGGVGADEIVNTGDVASVSVADADAVSVAAGITVAVGGNYTVAEATSTATADSVAINSGPGAQPSRKHAHRPEGITEILNGGDLVASASATSDGTSVTGNLLGAALGDTTNTAAASATGVRGGDGQDVVVNQGDLDTTSSATAGGVNVSVTLLGAALGDVTTIAQSTATGIDTGGDSDAVLNTGAITSTAMSAADAVGVSVGLVGAAGVQASTNAVSSATGIDTGSGPASVENGEEPHPPTDEHDTTDVGYTGDVPRPSDDTLQFTEVTNRQRIDVTASAVTSSSDVTVTLAGAAVGNAANNATGDAVGIRGGNGEDHVRNEAAITARSSANAGGTTVDVSLLGAALLDATSNANGVATAIRSGAGNDQIVNMAAISSSANGVARSNGVAVNLAGANDADATVNANADAFGIESGEHDDTIINTGGITARAGTIDAGNADGGCPADIVGACARTSNVNVGLVGGSSIDASVNANASSRAVSGGSGNDNISSDAVITVSAGARTDSSGVTVQLVGAGSSEFEMAASADAGGMTGDGGNDTIVSAGRIDASAGSSIAISSTSVTIAGSSEFDATLAASARAGAIDGGSGNDTIVNAANLSSTVRANLSSGGGSTVIFGASSSNALSGAVTDASGIRGGDGDDDIRNSGNVNAGSSAALSLANSGFTFGGAGARDGALRAFTHSSGLQADAGNDYLENTGILTVTASSRLTALSGSDVAFGASSVGATAGAATDVTGIQGGSGADILWNRATVNATSTSTLSMTGSQFTFGGSGDSGASLAAASASVGMSGGAGEDLVQNEGALYVDATSTMSSAGSSDVAFGASTAGSVSGASTDAIGVDTGQDNDILLNMALVDVSSSADISMSNSQFTFGGGGDTSNRMTASTQSRGLVAGTGNDRVENEGQLIVTAQSSLASRGGSDVAFGSSGASARAGANTMVTGIDAGSGDDTVLNRASISSTSTSTLILSGSSYTFGGTGDVSGRLSASTNSVGISGGGGNDAIRNDAAITARATTLLSSSGSVNTTFGTSASGALATTDTAAVGIEGNDGHDNLENFSSITVTTTSTASSANASYVFGGTSATRATASAFSRTTGMSGDGGNDRLYNAGSIDVGTSATMTGSGSASAEFGGASASGTVVGEAELYGISGGSGNDLIINDGTIQVTGATESSSSHSTDTGFLFGGGDSRTSARATLRADGIDAGSGNNEVSNTQSIAVEVHARTSSTTSSDGADVFDGDAFSRSDSNTSVAAIGIRSGNDADLINNDGSIDVSTRYAGVTTRADADAYADGDGIDGDGTAVAFAATTIFAAGIYAGHGANVVTNTGSITVEGRALANASASGDSDAGGTTSLTRTAPINDRAYGIYTGDGNDTITNNGLVTVVARSDRSGNGPYSTPAVGIRTGGGTDTVINNGTISATQIRDGVSSPGTPISAAGVEGESLGTAIATGDGDDTVVLNDGSVVEGHIDMGGGNNALALEGTPTLQGTVFDAESDLQLVFNNTGSFDGELPGASVIKNGEGTFSLSILTSMNHIQVNQGTLRVRNDYALMDEGDLFATVYGNGTHGQLQIDGTLALSGQLQVERGGGAYRDGAAYDVVSAGAGFGGSAFGDVALPESTPLLGFEYSASGDNVTVRADVESYTAVARTRNERAIAEHLDTILPNVSGSLSLAMGEVQFLTDESEFEGAFSSLSPAVYDSYRAVTLDSVTQYTETLHHRLRGLHVARHRGVRARSGSPFGSREPIPDAWVRAFAQSGTQDREIDVNDYDYDLKGVTLGYDVRFNRDWLAGVSAGVARSDVSSEVGNATGDVDATLGSVYASYLQPRFYFDAMASLAQAGYTNRREIVIGPSRETVTSEHDGSLYSLDVGGGYFVALNESLLEPYALLQYVRLDEERFSEQGSGASLQVEGSTSESLISQLGVRFSGLPSGELEGVLMPTLWAAWKHDFAIDDYAVAAAFNGAPDEIFTIGGRAAESDWLSMGFGVSYRSHTGVSTSLQYNGDFRDTFEAHAVVGELRMEF